MLDQIVEHNMYNNRLAWGTKVAGFGLGFGPTGTVPLARRALLRHDPTAQAPVAPREPGPADPRRLGLH